MAKKRVRVAGLQPQLQKALSVFSKSEGLTLRQVISKTELTRAQARNALYRLGKLGLIAGSNGVYALTGSKAALAAAKKPKERKKSEVVRAKIKPGADVTSCIPKGLLNKVDIFEEGCLLRFSAGNWGAKIPLRNEEYQDLPKDIVSGWKDLMRRKPLQEIQAIISQGWSVLGYPYALPFRSFTGARYVKKQWIPHVNERLEKLEAEYWERVDYFVDNEFDQERERMKETHPAFYEETAYPNKGVLRRKFHWSIDWIIVGLPDKEAGLLSPEQYKKEVEKNKERIRQFFNDALLVTAARFLELTTKLRNKLVNQEIFREQTIENLVEFIDQFPKANITRNRQLDNLVQTCKGYLKGVDIDVLKDNERFAAEVGKNMDKVVQEFGKLHDGELLRAIDI